MNATKVISFFRNNFFVFGEVRRAFQKEVRPKLEIPELEKVTREELLKLVDWELKQGEDRQKLFGVGSWSLLVGLAGAVWATASLPVLKDAELGAVALAFFLLESTLIALRVVWTAATRSPEAMDVDRSFRASIAGGADTNIAPVLSIVQSLLLLLAAFCWNDEMLRIAFYSVCGVLILSFLGQLFLLLFLKLDIQIILSRTSSEGQLLRPFLLYGLFVVLSVSVPVITWGWVGVNGKPPHLGDWQLAGLVVAAAYLLRQLLSSQAQARHQDFLRHLYRDLVLGFETPNGAAIKIAWRLSGFPTNIYIAGRFRALTSQHNQFQKFLEEQIPQLEAAVADLKNAEGEARETLRRAAANFLASRLPGRTAAGAGAMADMQAVLFLAFAGKAAKNSDGYKDWENSRKQVEVIGRGYEQAYAELQVLVNPNNGKD